MIEVSWGFAPRGARPNILEQIQMRKETDAPFDHGQ